MLTSVKGIFKEGNVYLLEKPTNITFSNVIITFIDELNDDSTFNSMILSEPAFLEWDNKEDEIYNTL
jgi:hypothetical protein